MSASLILLRLSNRCTTFRAASTLKMDLGRVQGLRRRILLSVGGLYCRARGGYCLESSIGCR
jgi:hypothetical protein